MKKVINYKPQKEDWEKVQDKVFKKLNSKQNIAGFRQGKAPRSVFERNFPGKIAMEAANEIIDQEYNRILKEDKLVPVLSPKIELIKITNDELEAKFTFILDPVVKLGDYKNLNVKKDTVKVTKDEIQKKIDTLLNDYAELVVKDTGAVEKGDIAIIDFEGFKDGVAFDGGKEENYSLEIGSNTFIPGFEDGVIGMKEGETKDINLTFPEDYGQEDLAGKDVVFKVKVNEIKNRIIPQLDEEFFKDLGMEGINTKEELEAKIKKEIKEAKEDRAEQKYIDDLLEKAVSNMEIEIDDEIIESEAEAMYKENIDRLAAQGMAEETYLEYAGTTKKDIVDHMKNDASRRLHNSYLLNAIIKEEGIEASPEEAQQEISKMAKKYKVTEEEIKEATGGVDAVAYDLKIKKAIDLMKSSENSKKDNKD